METQNVFEGPAGRDTRLQRTELLGEQPVQQRPEVDEEETRRNLDPTVAPLRLMVSRSLKQHRETTISAQRSLQIAEETCEMGKATLSEVARQGRQLDFTERGLDVLEDEVEEADSLIKFMRRCCLFQVLCCCCCDPDVSRDRTRKQRLQRRREDDEIVREAIFMTQREQENDIEDIISGKAPEVAKLTNKYGATASMTPEEVEESSKQQEAAIAMGAISRLEVEEIQEESIKQDLIVSRIGKAVDVMRAVSLEINRELREQDGQIDSIGERIEHTDMRLDSLSRKARKV